MRLHFLERPSIKDLDPVAERADHRRVVVKLVHLLGTDQPEKAGALVATVAADDILPVLVDLQAFVGELRLWFIGVVNPQERYGTPRGAAARRVALEKQHLAETGRLQEEGDAR